MFPFPIPFGLSIKTIAIGLAALAIVAIVGLGYWHYTSLLNKVTVLEADNSVLKGAVEVQKQTIKAAQGAIAEWQGAHAALERTVSELQQVTRSASEDTRRLNDLFARHNLEELARAKPGLVQRRLNSGTDDARRLLECASGAGHPDCPGRAAPPAR